MKRDVFVNGPEAGSLAQLHHCRAHKLLLRVRLHRFFNESIYFASELDLWNEQYCSIIRAADGNKKEHHERVPQFVLSFSSLSWGHRSVEGVPFNGVLKHKRRSNMSYWKIIWAFNLVHHAQKLFCLECSHEGACMAVASGLTQLGHRRLHPVKLT